MAKAHIRIFFLFVKNIFKGIVWFVSFKIKHGFNSYLCEDSDTNYSFGENDCSSQCFFCKTSTNTGLGFKFYDKKTDKWYRINKKIQ